MESDRTKNVLIVDDERALCQGTKRLLEDEGYCVSTAENGSEGISLGTCVEYDIALIDLKMPDINGLKVLTEILKAHPNTVCIVATGYASYETAIEATKIGAFSYIPKPFTSEELLRLLNQAEYKREILIEKAKWTKEREERLLEVAFEKTRLNTIINSISDGLLVINKNSEAVLFNPSLLKFLELDNIKIEERIIDRLHPELSNLINKVFSASKKEKKSYSAQIELKADNQLYVEATCSPVVNHDGEIAGIVVVLKDITNLKKIELLKSQFVSMVSHELKAPLAAVNGYLQLLSDKSFLITEEQKQSFILKSQKRIDGLLKMINDLLDLSRIELKKIRREIENLDLTELIKSAIELFQLNLKAKNISVTFNAKSNMPKLKGDREEIGRLFTNLIGNAIKYNCENGFIKITMEYLSHFIVVAIQDGGIGMKPEEKKKLFHEFFRAKNELTKDISGTGLGLSIVKHIVDSYSGKIEVESEYKVGTIIKIFLPAFEKN